jgi:hypothetical protein
MGERLTGVDAAWLRLDGPARFFARKGSLVVLAEPAELVARFEEEAAALGVRPDRGPERRSTMR